MQKYTHYPNMPQFFFGPFGIIRSEEGRLVPHEPLNGKATGYVLWEGIRAQYIGG